MRMPDDALLRVWRHHWLQRAPHLPILGLALPALDKGSGSGGGGGGDSRGRIAKLNWMSLVEQYSRRSLTRLSDKLIAMDSPARMVEGVTASNGGGLTSSQLSPLGLDNTAMRPAYVEGLFPADVAQQLLWACHKPVFQDHYHQQHQIPLLAGRPHSFKRCCGRGPRSTLRSAIP